MPQVLFLCTGNYYRSRFAELVFNHERSGEAVPGARLAGVRLSPRNAGALSQHALGALERLQIRIAEPIRFPAAATDDDFRRAGHVVALKRTEHEPMLDAAFPQWKAVVEFWEIHDLDCATAEEALPAVERAVAELLERLSR